MEANKRTDILNAIISKGGLMGNCAKLYLNDEVMGHQFIIECSEQCHLSLTFEYFGKELVYDIVKYSKNISDETLTLSRKLND